MPEDGCFKWAAIVSQSVFLVHRVIAKHDDTRAGIDIANDL
jgi:hypothetical protein